MGKLIPGEQDLDHAPEFDSQLIRLSLGIREVTGPYTSPGLAPIFVLWHHMGNSVSSFKHWLILLF